MLFLGRDISRSARLFASVAQQMTAVKEQQQQLLDPQTLNDDETNEAIDSELPLYRKSHRRLGIVVVVVDFCCTGAIAVSLDGKSALWDGVEPLPRPSH